MEFALHEDKWFLNRWKGESDDSVRASDSARGGKLFEFQTNSDPFPSIKAYSMITNIYILYIPYT